MVSEFPCSQLSCRIRKIGRVMTVRNDGDRWRSRPLPPRVRSEWRNWLFQCLICSGEALSFVEWPPRCAHVYFRSTPASTLLTEAVALPSPAFRGTTVVILNRARRIKMFMSGFFILTPDLTSRCVLMSARSLLIMRLFAYRYVSRPLLSSLCCLVFFLFIYEDTGYALSATFL